MKFGLKNTPLPYNHIRKWGGVKKVLIDFKDISKNVTNFSILAGKFGVGGNLICCSISILSVAS